MKSKFLLSALFMGIFMVAAAQTTINVPEDYETIQEAIDAAQDGDIVLVAPGTYYENINYDGKIITVKSHFNPEEPDSSILFNTIIDGSQPSNADIASVVTMPYGSDTNCILKGFTVQLGTGTLEGDIRYGGGICCLSGGKVIHNIIIDNYVDQDYLARGGGVFFNGYGALHFFVLRNNIIENNSVINDEEYPAGAIGGGVYCRNGTIIIENNIIKGNYAEGRPIGCGLYNWQCKGEIDNNIIAGNTGLHQFGSQGFGAGMYIQNYLSGMNITCNTIEENEIAWGVISGGGICIYTSEGYENNLLLIDRNVIRNNVANKGGGIFLESTMQATLSNNAIIGNQVTIYGGGIGMSNEFQEKGIAPYINNLNADGTRLANSGSNMPLIVNNTIVNNYSESYGGGIASFMYNDCFLAFNNIFYGNSADYKGDEIYLNNTCDAYLSYNDIDLSKIEGYGTWEGSGNIEVDPCFCCDSIHIQGSSCCRDKGIVEIEIAGTKYICPGHDIDGEHRPKSGSIDLGADECLLVSLKEITDNYTDVLVFPNPFTTATTLSFRLFKPENVQFTVYNVQSQIVFEMQERQGKGEQRIQWNAEGLPAGMYYFRIQAGEKVGEGKMVKMD